MLNAGFKIYKNVISRRSSETLFNDLNNFLRFYSPDLFNNKKFKRKWLDKEFNDKLIHLRVKSKKTFSSVYQTILKSNSLYKF